MAKLPIYTQRYQQGARKAGIESFGAAQNEAQMRGGKQMEEAGQALLEFDARRRNRKDTIERVRAINEFNRLADEEFTRMSTEEDLTDTEAPTRYGQFTSQKMNELVANHTGSAESKAELAAQLEGYAGQYNRNMYKTSTSAQFKAMDNYMTTRIKQFSDMSGDMPGSIDVQFAGLDKEIEKMSAALTQEQQVAYREAGRSQILQSGISTLIDAGDYDGADTVLSKPGVAETLDPDVHRQIKAKIIVGQRELEKGRLAGQNKLNELETILGRKPTPEERARAAGVAVPKGSQTVSEKIADAERILGRPLNQNEIAKMYDIDTGESSLYGKSLRGQALSRIDSGIVAFSNGALSPQEDRRFQADIMEAYGPIRVEDEITGMAKMVPGKPAPPYVQEALARRGMEHLLDRQQSETPLAPADPAIGVQPLQEGQKGLWDDLPLISGPIAAAEGTIESMPFIGGLTDQDVTRAKTRASGIQRNTVTALQNNPKYAEGERKAIEDEISLIPGIWSNPENAQATLIAVDENLMARQNTAYKTSIDSTLPVDVRQAAFNVLNIVQNVRSQFNLPPRVKSAEEARKLPVGSQFIDPNGNVRIVPKRTTGETNGNQ